MNDYLLLVARHRLCITLTVSRPTSFYVVRSTCTPVRSARRWCGSVAAQTFKTSDVQSTAIKHQSNGRTVRTVRPVTRQHTAQHNTVAVWGCLPPGANVCVAAPANQSSSAVRVFFGILDMEC